MNLKNIAKYSGTPVNMKEMKKELEGIKIENLWGPEDVSAELEQ